MCLTIGLTFIHCSNPYTGVVLLSIGVGAFGLKAIMANINELAGSYSGMLFGISNTLATLPGNFLLLKL